MLFELQWDQRSLLVNRSTMQKALLLRSITGLALAAAALCALPLRSAAQSAPETWALEQGRGIAAAQVNGPSLKLQGQQLSGSTGCNSFTATISGSGQRVKIENISLTRKLCAPSRNETEHAFVNALGQTEYIERKSERLTFLSGQREPLLVWKISAALDGTDKARDRETKGTEKGTEIQPSMRGLPPSMKSGVHTAHHLTMPPAKRHRRHARAGRRHAHGHHRRRHAIRFIDCW